jgi:hypothetical protein
VDPRAGLDDLEKRRFLTLPGLELRSLSRRARSQSPYRIRYLGSPPPPITHVIICFTESSWLSMAQGYDVFLILEIKYLIGYY